MADLGYAIIDAEHRAFQDEITMAARTMEIKVHPGRLKRAEGLTPIDLDTINEQAKRVGSAL